mmetsp:Transcript_29413/g.80410  ORF Transcript_29413/g.80410 Transcript_29413/m.80410 type:complete len:104 (+) Transcript_29413:877-1188(+)
MSGLQLGRDVGVQREALRQWPPLETLKSTPCGHDDEKSKRTTPPSNPSPSRGATTLRCSQSGLVHRSCGRDRSMAPANVLRHVASASIADAQHARQRLMPLPC